MVSRKCVFDHQITLTLWVLISCGVIYGTDTDIFCLKSIKDSLQDPNNYLQSWDFNNKAQGFICGFSGVECWNPFENRVLNINLSNMGLRGQFPRAIRSCSSLTGLDLSANKLFGIIPKDISTLLPFVTSFDLSSNQFSGAIPSSIANCTYLNDIILDHNKLVGRIPTELAGLVRLKTFDVANNLLTGQVPRFNYHQVKVNYANNSGLCGGPLPACKGIF